MKMMKMMVEKHWFTLGKAEVTTSWIRNRMIIRQQCLMLRYVTGYGDLIRVIDSTKDDKQEVTMDSIVSSLNDTGKG